LTFSPESRFLASAGRDGYVGIWDTATKLETAALRADRAWVTSIAFAPEGRRLVSGSSDGTVRIWDMATHREAAALFRGLNSDFCQSLAFAPDGRTLAFGGINSVHMWEGEPLSPRQSIDREALGLVRFLVDRATSLRDLRERIQHDLSISEAVRAAALLLAGSLWDDHTRARAEQEAEKLVEALFAVAPLREEVEEALRTRLGLDPQVRAIAIELAGSWGGRDTSKALYEASWAVVRESGYRPSEYRRALRRAEEASGDSPQDPFALFVLGVAQYRNGRYRESLSTLEPLTGDQGLFGGDEYPRRAFMALSRFKLGQIDEARRSLEKTLADYRADPQGPAFLLTDITAILREAQTEILLGPAFPDDPFAP
jgi:tetratricopeptide (TPR) repeat protein